MLLLLQSRISRSEQLPSSMINPALRLFQNQSKNACHYLRCTFSILQIFLLNKYLEIDCQVQASHVMTHLQLRREASERSRIEQMVNGPASFIEGKPSTMKTNWGRRVLLKRQKSYRPIRETISALQKG